MNPNLKKLLIALGVVGAIGAAGFAYIFSQISSRPEPKAPIDVPVSWEHVREGPMHKLHMEQAVACTNCHVLAEAGTPGMMIAPCSICHAQASEPIHLATQVGNDFGTPRCQDCHAFRPGALVKPWNCQRCHEKQQGPHAPISVHLEQDCDACHLPHDKRGVPPTDCSSCHAMGAIHTGGWSRDTDTCLQCHGGHTKGADVPDRCAWCHSGQKPIVPRTATQVRGHESCITCHKPHERFSGGKKACTDCHVDTVALAATRVKEHADCKNCHPQHNVKASGDTRCKTCHEIEAKHPAKDGKTCTACHPAHDHRVIKDDLGQLACAVCHVDQGKADLAQHGKAVACRDCHPTHEFDAAKGKTCETCHQEVVALVTPKKHDQCSDCHAGELHRIPDTKPACAECHEEPARTITNGHQDCKTCHEVHSAKVETVCADCHAPQAKSKHGKIDPTCHDCHRPHGPKGVAKPPVCQSCHKDLKKLHNAKEHNTCNTCHDDGHNVSKPDTRAKCIECHGDQTKHEPKAKLCAGCHPFKG